jgi:ferredoxin-NADP reductase
MNTGFALMLVRRETVAEGVVLLTLRPPEGGPVPSWEPGAHVDVEVAPGLTRQYSLCGDPADRSSLLIAVLREPAGRGGSRAVHEDLAEGDVVTVRGPRNNFPLVRAGRYLFIAGGIGITPLRPMLAAVEAAGADWRLVYGGRTREAMAFRAELCRTYGDRVTVCPQDEAGLLDLDALRAGTAPGTEVYCCGPAPLLAAVEARWPAGSLHVERRPGALVLPRGDLRHLRDGRARRRARPPRHPAHRGGTGRLRHDDDLCVAVPVGPARPRSLRRQREAAWTPSPADP